MKAIKISIDNHSLSDGFKPVPWSTDEKVTGFQFYLFNNPDTGGAVFQSKLEGTEREQLRPGQKLIIEIK